MSKAQQYRITQHATQRYRQRRGRQPLYITADICRARPVTKSRMRKLGRRTKAGQHMLITPDGFAFVAAGTVIITCFYLGS